MSGSSKKKAASSGNATAGASSKSMPMQTVQPFMPGMEQMLAQQLAAGFGGTPQSYTSAFSEFYAPTEVAPQAQEQSSKVGYGSGDPNKHVMNNFERRWVLDNYDYLGADDGFASWLNTNPQLYKEYVTDRRAQDRSTDFSHLVRLYSGSAS